MKLTLWGGDAEKFEGRKGDTMIVSNPIHEKYKGSKFHAWVLFLCGGTRGRSSIDTFFH